MLSVVGRLPDQLAVAPSEDNRVPSDFSSFFPSNEPRCLRKKKKKTKLHTFRESSAISDRENHGVGSGRESL